jgi:1,4-alpha-glucan branching enzyme
LLRGIELLEQKICMNTLYYELSDTEIITFHCPTTHAAKVCLVGDFNDWRPAAHPMERQTDGSWFLQLPLRHGRHHYQFLVDGEPVLDPEAICAIHKQRNSKVSLIALG